ncbi:metallothionein-like protein 4B [Salvia divinorum]|uniref:Metallothionein-like protein 4B n=1 Tax=Salvia divinorum TaxID=28513 RepID=A0ABD1GDU4_SALDI
MADMKGSGVVCDESCGCPSPCPGGTACSCKGGGAEGSTMDHKKCSCGEHCGCNPCTCTKITGTGTGKAHCRCGTGCTCATCAA